MQRVFFIGLYILFLLGSFLILQFEKTRKIESHLENKTQLYGALYHSAFYHSYKTFVVDNNLSTANDIVFYDKKIKEILHLNTYLFIEEKLLSDELRYQKDKFGHFYLFFKNQSINFTESSKNFVSKRIEQKKVFTIYDKKIPAIVTVIPIENPKLKSIPAFIMIMDDADPIKVIELDFALLLLLVYGFSFVVLIFIWKLNQKKSEIDKLIEIMSDNVIFARTNLNGTIKDVSKAFCKNYGYSEGEVILKNYNMVIHPDLSLTYKDNFWRKRRLQNGWKGKVKQQSKSGSLLWMHLVITPELGPFGKIEGYLLITTNITDAVQLKELSKELESQMNKSKEKDAIYINQLIQHQLELSTSLIAQKEGEKSKDLFLANMSHEIRTPLNGIIGFLSLLKQTPLSKQQKEYLEMSQNSSKILLTIINDILDFSKMSAGKFELDLQPNNCNIELARVAKIFTAQMEQKGLKFTVDIDKNFPLCIMCDSNRLKQVFINLLGNAMKFTKEGEVIFSVKVLEETEHKATIRYSVKDTGIGIPKEKQALVFEAFSQADKFIGTKFGGTGLGISIANNIIAMAGGKLQLKSEIDKGSEFYFVLTVQKCANELSLIKSEKEMMYETIHYKENHILVAEDNKTNQMLIEILLKQRGLKPTIVDNGQMAVDYYMQDPNKYALILMDIQMPIKDGIMATFDILDFEKTHQIDHTKIVALTANAITGDREKYFENGMDDYLPKPIDSKDLDSVLQKYLPIESITSLNLEDINNSESLDTTILDGEISEVILYDLGKVEKEFGIDRKTLFKLLKTFFQNFNDNKEELLTKCKEKDFDNIKKISHFLKGSSGSMKLEKVFQITQEMEYEALQKNAQFDWEEKVLLLEKSVEEYKAFLNTLIKNGK